MKTTKERLYSEAHDEVAKLMGKGYTLTIARQEVSKKSGLAYGTIVRITLDLNPARKCETCKAE